MNNTLTWEDFEKVDIRCGTILAASSIDGLVKPAIQMVIDFGELGTKKSSAQITKRYKPEEIVGKQVMAVVNFPPKQIKNFISECLVLGIYDAKEGVTLITSDKKVENGSKIG